MNLNQYQHKKDNWSFDIVMIFFSVFFPPLFWPPLRGILLIITKVFAFLSSFTNPFFREMIPAGIKIQ